MANVATSLSRAILPNLNHLDLEILEHVYEPSDDTYLLCDCLLGDKQDILSRNPLICVEIGSGSGCVITYLGQLLKESSLSPCLFGTDINIRALAATKLTALHNDVRINCVQSSLLSGMDHLRGKIDVMLFNPPYVPTPDEEIAGCGIEASWAGGTDGRVIIDKFLPIIKGYLSSRGVCYLLLVRENKPEEIKSILRSMGLKSQVAIQRRALNEYLCVLRITHCDE